MNALQEIFSEIRANPKVAIYGSIGTVLAFYLSGVYRSALMLVFAIIGVILVWGLTEEAVGEIAGPYVNQHREIAEQIVQKNRGTIYFSTFCAWFFISWFLTGIAAAPIYPGDEDSMGNVAQVYQAPAPCEKRSEWHWNFFYLVITPALVGARNAMGRPKK